MDENIIIARFPEGKQRVMVSGLWQWDYGQILKMEGLPDPPETLEVHFTQGGESKTVLGVTEEGVLNAQVPNAMLTHSAMIGALVFLHTGEDDGETEFRVYMPVRAREQPETYDEDDPQIQEEYSALVQATLLLRDGIDEVEGYAGAARESAEAAAQSAEEAAHATTDYERMTNKPKIESVELVGNKSLEDIGVDHLSNADLARILT